VAISSQVNTYGVKPQTFIKRSPTSSKKEVYGLEFPLGKSTTTGGFFKKKSGVDLIKGAVKQLLLTERGERVMLPDYGCNIRRFLFQPLDETLFENIKQEILTSFYKYIVGATVLRIAVVPLNVAGPSGGNSLKVTLTIKLVEEDLVVFEVPVIIS